MSQSETVVLAWDQNLDDRVEGELQLGLRLLRRRTPALLAVLALVAGSLGLLLGWIAPLIVALAVVVALAVRPMVLRTRLRRTLAKAPDALTLGPTRWALDASGIEIEMPGRLIQVPWSSVREVGQTRKVALLWLSRSRALFVPLRAVPAPEVLVARVAEWRADPSAPRGLPAPEGEPWTLAYTPTLDDHLAYVASVVGRAGPVWQPLILGVLFMAMSLPQGLLSLGSGSVAGLVASGLVFAVGLLFSGLALFGRALWLLRLRLRWARWRDPESFPAEALALTVGEGGLHYASARGSGRIEWSRLSSVVEADGCVALMMGPLVGFGIPDRAFADAEARAEFVRQCTRWSERATRLTEVPGERGAVRETDNPFSPPEDR